jgi:hypothetical protein
MAVKYRLVQKFNPQKPDDPKKYYAAVVTRGDVSLRELSKELALISTVSIADVMATIEALLEIIPRHWARSFVSASSAHFPSASPAKACRRGKTLPPQ